MQENAIKVVLSNTFTVTDAHERLALLQEFLEHVFYGGHGGASSREALDDFVKEKRLAGPAVEALRGWDALFATITAGTLYERLNKLLADIKVQPVLTLYVPVEFGPDEVALLGAGARKLMGSDILLDMHTDPRIGAGCTFVWNGVFHDYSIAYFMKQHHEDMRVLVNRYGSKA